MARIVGVEMEGVEMEGMGMRRVERVGKGVEGCVCVCESRGASPVGDEWDNGTMGH